MDSLDQCIVNACKNSWDKSYLAGTPNKDNCSGFVQSVAAELGVPMPRGNANAMVDGLEQSWTKLASGAEAAQKAAQGFLVIAGLKGRTYGHVAVVISGPLYRQKYPMCWCGSIAGAVGQSQGLKSVGQVWNRTDRDRLNYYVYSLACCSGPWACFFGRWCYCACLLPTTIPHEHPDSTRPSLRRLPAHSDLRIPPVYCDKTAPGIFPARE